MFEAKTELNSGAIALVTGEKDLIANLANLSSHFFHTIPGLNWAGFYLWNEKDQELVLGPFQGKPACIRIQADKGVCGKAYSTRKVQRIDDVHLFPGHIACDPNSQSELVVPMLWNNRCVGVLDFDAPTTAHFSPELAIQMENLMSQLMPILWDQ